MNDMMSSCCRLADAVVPGDGIVTTTTSSFSTTGFPNSALAAVTNPYCWAIDILADRTGVTTSWKRGQVCPPTTSFSEVAEHAEIFPQVKHSLDVVLIRDTAHSG
jgi:hypothetical protein